MRKRWASIAAALTVVGLLGVVWRAKLDGESVRVVRGEVGMVSFDGVGVGVDGEGYLVGTGRPWLGIDGAWRESGQPECLPPGSSGAIVELGLLPIPDEHGAGGYPNNVAWVRCLSLPVAVAAEVPPTPLDLAYRQALAQGES